MPARTINRESGTRLAGASTPLVERVSGPEDEVVRGDDGRFLRVSVNAGLVKAIKREPRCDFDRGARGQEERLHAGVNDYSSFDAVLLIGDEALRRNKSGLQGFELVFDLAKEWYDWKKMPFVFAVWAVKKSLGMEAREELRSLLEHSLTLSLDQFGEIGELHGKQIGLSRTDVEEYLGGFSYQLGDRERTAMQEFRKLVEEKEKIDAR